MKRKVLFICNTYYHYIVSLWLIRSLLKDDICDIVISDIPTDSRKIVEKSQNLSFVRNVFYVKAKFLQSISKFNYLSNLFFTQSFFKKTDIYEKNYDFIFTANLECFVTLVYTFQKKYKNKNVQLCWFEDGFGTYSYEAEYFSEKKHKGFSLKNFLSNLLFKYRNISSFVTKLYLFRPDLLVWKPSLEIVKIPSINKNDQIFISALNNIFEYSLLKDDYKKKIIFFEDGFSDWDRNVDDINLLDRIAGYVGKENIIVKIHPRNMVNRFNNLGFMTNKNLSVPWEIIALNSDFSNSFLVTLYSQAVIIPSLLFGIESNVIYLYELTEPKTEQETIYKNFFRKLFSSINNKNIHVPENYDKLEEILIGQHNE